MVFATPSSAKPEQAWKNKTCLQCCIKVQRSMPEYWSSTRVDWNNLQISRRTNSPDSWHRIDVSTSASSRTGQKLLEVLWRTGTDEPVQMYKYQLHVLGAKSSPTCANYVLKRVGLDNEEDYPIATKNTKQLLHGRFHQINRNPGGSNWTLQSTTTSSLITWIRTEEVDKQQRCS